MKLPTKLLTGLFLLATAVFTFSSCGNDDDNAKPVPRSETYNFTAYGTHEITGTALFTEVLNTDSVKVTVELKGKDINDLVSLPVIIREGTSLESGDVISNLGNFKGSDGKLVKTIKLSFDNLLTLNGSMAVYGPSDNILSQAEIGTNTTYESHTMTNLTGSEMNGQFRIYKRPTGSYLVIKIDLEGIASICDGVDHPAKIYKADGSPEVELNAVADSSGISATSLTDYSYDDLKNYNGFVKVLCSETATDVSISKGNF